MWSSRNRTELDAAGVDDLVPGFWKLRCGCLVRKSRHAVSNRLRRAAQGGFPRSPACFECPFHGAGRRSASFAARRAFALLCGIAASLYRTCTVVWEGRPIAGLSAFDFWLVEWGVLVEVDGAQHTEGSHHGVSTTEQALRDATARLSVPATTWCGCMCRMRFSGRVWCGERWRLRAALWLARPCSTAPRSTRASCPLDRTYYCGSVLVLGPFGAGDPDDAQAAEAPVDSRVEADDARGLAVEPLVGLGDVGSSVMAADPAAPSGAT